MSRKNKKAESKMKNKLLEVESRIIVIIPEMIYYY